MNNFSQTIRHLFFVLPFLCLAFTACKKEEIKGPQGDPGANGTGGNSSTSSSANFVISSTLWTATASTWEYTYSSALITKDAVDKGAVKVFVEKDAAWWELPFADGDLMTQSGFSEGKVKLVIADLHGGLPTKPATATYRLVVLSESARMALPITPSVQKNLLQAKSVNQ